MKLLFMLFNLSEELEVVVCNCNHFFQSVQCTSGEFSVKKIAFFFSSVVIFMGVSIGATSLSCCFV